VITGPHTENFREIFAKGEGLGIATRVAHGRGLADPMARELSAPDLTARGEAARAFVEASRGAADATAADVVALLDPTTAESGATG
jgi:3-deoxy-D-manno-octulosonic-acid transferase